MKAQLEAGSVARQQLLVPLTFDVSETDAQWVEDLAEHLRKVGWSSKGWVRAALPSKFQYCWLMQICNKW